MIRFKTILFAAICFAAGVSLAAPSISIDSAKQRYPWNGLVDVSYTISGVDEAHAYEVKFMARANGVTKVIELNTEPHCKLGSDTMMTNGSFTAIWDAASEGYFPETIAPDCEFFAVINDLGGEAYPADATGEPTGYLGSMMVLDISSGPTSTNYPVEYWPCADTGRFNCDAYKTSKIALRKVCRNKHFIGCNSGPNSSAFVALPEGIYEAKKDYWVCLFQVTQKQYANIVGAVPDGQRTLNDILPVTYVSRDIIRGTGSILSPPVEDSVLGKINARTKTKSSMRSFELLTRCQAEIATRGGISTRFYVGNTLPGGMSDYGVFNRSTSGSPDAVGTKLPSPFGIYDLKGNVWEWTLDNYDGTTVVPPVDEPYTSGSYGFIFGGSFWDVTSNYWVQLSSHHYIETSYCWPAGGFRFSIMEK